MAKIVEGINVTAPLETLKAFAKFLQNIPDDIKDTIFFFIVLYLKNINLRASDTEMKSSARYSPGLPVLKAAADRRT